MARPTVAILGRPNVGKSTLFNRLVGQRLALVDDLPGVTRDRREGEGRLHDLAFRVIDTAGFEEADAASLAGRMRAQTEAALEISDAALFLIDARAGLTPLDRTIADWLRSSHTPVILIANKAEGRAGEAGMLEAYELGLGDPLPFSAEHGEGLADLFEYLHPILDPIIAEGDGDPEPLPDVEEQAPEGEDDETAEAEGSINTAPLKFAIVGRPNAGKSTLINRLVGEERLITGPEAGITRDSISIEWEWQGRPVRLIDTAGLRRRAKVTGKLERLSAADTRRAIDFAEVVVLLLDGTLGLEAQDLRIASAVIEEGRGFLVALNKWDVAPDQSRNFQGVKKALEEGLAQIKGTPLLTVSGKTGKGLDALVEVAFAVRDKWSRRISTARLNRWFGAAVDRNPPPSVGGRRIKLRYITQARTRPPTFIVFGNRVDQLPESYRRYLVNNLREALDLAGVPIRLSFRSSSNPFDR
jgi:GTP-binding protein